MAIIGLACSIPFFYMYKIRGAYHEGDFVYTVMYVKPKPKIHCTGCEPIESNFENVFMLSKNIILQLILCMCLIVFIIKLPNIIDHFNATKSKCKQRHDERNVEENNETTNLEHCESDLSLVPAILIIIVLFSVLICASGVIKYLRYLKIVKPPVGRPNMVRAMNILLEMPFNIGCVAKPLIYLAFSSRYRAEIEKLVKNMLCGKRNINSETNA